MPPLSVLNHPSAIRRCRSRRWLLVETTRASEGGDGHHSTPGRSFATCLIGHRFVDSRPVNGTLQRHERPICGDAQKIATASKRTEQECSACALLRRLDACRRMGYVAT